MILNSYALSLKGRRRSSSSLCVKTPAQPVGQRLERAYQEVRVLRGRLRDRLRGRLRGRPRVKMLEVFRSLGLKAWEENAQAVNLDNLQAQLPAASCLRRVG